MLLNNKPRLTKRAPDAGDSAHIPSSFLRLIIFLAGRLRRPRPSAGNANRWALARKYKNRLLINLFRVWVCFFCRLQFSPFPALSSFIGLSILFNL